MSTLDYDQFDRATLLKIMDEIPVELKKRDKVMRQELKSKMQKLAEEAGYSLDEILAGGKAKTPTKKAAPKYENPDDPSTTWTGRGRKPLWVVAALEEGKTLEDLEIS